MLNRKYVVLKINFCVMSVLLFAGCSTVPITGRTQLSLVSRQQLVALSNQNYIKIMKEAKLSTDKAKTAMVKNVGQRIAAATEEFMKEKGLTNKIRDYQWEFNLIEDNEKVNAFAVPGGKIVAYTALLPVAKNDAGLATVMGHEVAHVIANHGGERMSHLLLTQLGGITLAVATKEKSDETRRLAMTAYGAGAVYGAILPYSRVHEAEADRIGLILMAKAGYDPREAIPFWERMNKARKGLRLPSFLSTHPAPASRIKKIQSYLPEALEHYKK